MRNDHVIQISQVLVKILMDTENRNLRLYRFDTLTSTQCYWK